MRTVYHIFTDGIDEYRDTLEQAEAVYKEYEQKGCENIRLYKEVYENITDDPIETEVIKSKGLYPTM